MRRAIERACGVLPGELGGVARAVVVQFLLLTAFNCLRPLRDALGVRDGGSALPWLFSATFVGSVLAAPLFGFAAARWPLERLVPRVLRVVAATLLGLLPAVMLGKPWAAPLLFVWISVANMAVLSLFWSVMADRHAPDRATRLFGPIALGASMGAIAGPSVALLLAQLGNPLYLLLVAAGLLEGAAYLGRPLWRRESVASPELALGGHPFAGATELLRSSQLRMICVYLVAMTTASTVLYFMQGRLVAAAFAEEETRTSVFAAVDLVVNVLALCGQAFVAGRVMGRFGVGAALVLLPAVCALGFVAIAVWPVAFVVLAAQGLRRVANYAFAKPARESLFTAVPRESRFKAKNFIDTVVYRGGDAAAGWLFTGLGATGVALTTIAAASVPLIAAWGWLGARLGRGTLQSSGASAAPELRKEPALS